MKIQCHFIMKIWPSPVTINLDSDTPPFFVPPGPYNNIIMFKYLDPLALIIIISEIYGPPHMLSTIAEIQKGQGLGSGYKWLAGLVSRSAWGSKYFGVQLSRDSPQYICIVEVQCNLDYPDPFVHRPIATIPDKWNVQITEMPTFLAWFMIPSI